MQSDQNEPKRAQSADPQSLPTDDPTGPAQLTIEQRVMALERKANARDQQKPSDDLANVIKRGEWWVIGIQAATLIAIIISAAIYYAQLQEMVGVSGQTDTLTRAYRRLADASGKQADASTIIAEQARTQALQITNLADDTKTLADNEGVQAQQTSKLANETHALASEAGVQAKAANELASISAGQLATMRSELELRDRPWIKVVGIKLRGDSIIKALSFQDLTGFQAKTGISYQVMLNYEISTKNVGGSAALNVRTIPELYLPRWGKFDVVAEEKRLCDQVEKDMLPASSRGNTLFATEQHDEYQGVPGIIRPENINRYSDRPGSEYVIPVLIGCVDYQFQSSPIHHQTRFIYELFNLDQTRNFEIGIDVKASDIMTLKDDSDDYAY